VATVDVTTVGNYVPRNADSGSTDFDLTDLTTDGTYRDLDLSSILPANAIGVQLTVSLLDDAADQALQFRRNGNSNNEERVVAKTQVANITNSMSLIVACDTSQVIEYNASNTTWSAIYIHVLGWFI